MEFDAATNPLPFYASWQDYIDDLVVENAKHRHVSDGSCYTSDPPMSRCKECGEFYR